MFAITNGSLRSAWLLAGCFVFLLSCTPKPPASAPGGNASEEPGPGGDDDRPITMEGGSFTVKWEPKAGKPDNGFDLDDGLYKHSKNGTSNKIICDLGGNFELRRKNGKSLVVTVEFSGGEYEFLQAITKKNGKHLTIGLLREFDASVPDQLKYPETSVKVERVVLDNVQHCDRTRPFPATARRMRRQDQVQYELSYRA